MKQGAEHSAIQKRMGTGSRRVTIAIKKKRNEREGFFYAEKYTRLLVGSNDSEEGTDRTGGINHERRKCIKEIVGQEENCETGALEACLGIRTDRIGRAGRKWGKGFHYEGGWGRTIVKDSYWMLRGGNYLGDSIILFRKEIRKSQFRITSFEEMVGGVGKKGD